MSHKLVIYISAHSQFDQTVIEHFIQQGDKLLLLSPSPEISDSYKLIPQCKFDDFECSESPAEDFYQTLFNLGLIHVQSNILVLHGVGVSEANIFDCPTALQPILLNLEQSFKAFCLLNDLLREHGGNVIFPMYSDALSYQGDDVATITNHAKKAFMMSYSKEMNAFNVNVNCMVMPHLAIDEKDRKQIKRSLRGSVFGMKPTIYTQEDFIVYMDTFCAQNQMMTGQCINFRHQTGFEL
jgi:hypothetical protein